MSKRAEERGLEALPPRWRKTKDGKGRVDGALPVRKFYIRAYEQAEKDILSIIQSRLEEIPGDAQPRPILRVELQELMIKIMEGEK